MSRYYSDSDDAHYASRTRSNYVSASGWQSPLPTSVTNGSAPPSAVTRLVVDSPYGTKKCDYTIDKSQRGRLIVTAHRRQTFASDYLSSKNKKETSSQTFTIPPDADVDRLRSYVEKRSNRLIIEIPRTNQRMAYPSSYHRSNAQVDFIRPPEMERVITPPLRHHERYYTRPAMHDNRTVDYRIDCAGYTAEELEVFIQGRDLIVQGKSNRATSPNSTRQQSSAQRFSRKLTLPPNVDLSRVVSYLENGELRVQAPLKHSGYHYEEEIISPKYNRVRSQTPSNGGRHYYRRHERVSRHRNNDEMNLRQASSPVRRVRSAESLSYPFDRSGYVRREDDGDDFRENRRRRTTNYERRVIDRADAEQPYSYRSVYSPTNHLVTSRTAYRSYPSEEETYFHF